ncbi:unnamed protein product [Schistosoma mattheei]|uniref:C2H2-type domain-containing protein n=1 Tax=Schistosoma mattheei TaxID=31246 RepID=A0AA85BMW9_9TREM|nr:unnamed protein product [Schistosoma mattheei]
MQISVEPDVFEQFHKLKQLHKPVGSDSEFLSFIVSHIQKCCYKSDSCNPTVQALPNGTSLRSCPECKFSAGTSEQLWDHFESVHPDEGSFSCTCGDSYNRLPLFLRHYVDCPVASTDLEDPRRNFASLKDGRRILPSILHSNCDGGIAGTKLGQPNVYHPYRQSTVSSAPGPSGDKPYGCPKCYKGFKSKSLLDQHMHLHFPPRYKCRWCGNVYRWPPVYYHHKQRCKKRPVISMSEIGHASDYRCLNGSVMKVEDSQMHVDHISPRQTAFNRFVNAPGVSFTQELANDNIIQNVPVIGDDAANCSLTCLCTESFLNVPSYLEHATICPKVVSASSVFENLANRALSTSNNLGFRSPRQRNSISNFRELPPEYLSQLKDTTLMHSNPGGIFSCNMCGKEFNSKLSLKQHVDGKHRAEGKYLCGSCGKRYRWGASFYYHKKTCAGPVSCVLNSQTPELVTTHT